VSNAERRALTHGESPVAARVIDIYAALPSMTGKFELEYEGELKGADFVAREVIRGAVSTVFDGYFPDADLRSIVEWFDLGGTLNLGDGVSAADVVSQARGVQGLLEAAWRVGITPDASTPMIAAGVDFVLEGLYSQKKIGRSEDRGYHGTEPVRRREAASTRTPVLTPDDDDDEQGGQARSKKKRYYN
jgi:magnesium chelatase subunit I